MLKYIPSCLFPYFVSGIIGDFKKVRHENMGEMLVANRSILSGTNLFRKNLNGVRI